MSEVKLTPIVPLLAAAEKAAQAGMPAAIGAFNVNFYTQAEGILEGLRRTDAAGIIQASKGACKFQEGADKVAYMLKNAMANNGHALPVCLHLDHGDIPSAINCAQSGFSSVMIDASKYDYVENIATTRVIAEYAHSLGVTVEGEYGKLAGVEEDVQHETTTYADPTLVPHFFRASNADALAVAYGTSHGPNKGSDISGLAVHIVKESYNGMVANNLQDDHFLVGHGSSTVPKELVDEINSCGGQLKDAHGVPMDKILEAIECGLRKINIDTDLRLGITATFRKYYQDNPGIEDTSEVLKDVKKCLDEQLDVVDPRDYLGVVPKDMLREPPAGTPLEEVMGSVKERIAEHVEFLVEKFGSAGLAGKVEG